MYLFRIILNWGVENVNMSHRTSVISLRIQNRLNKRRIWRIHTRTHVRALRVCLATGHSL